MTITLRPWQADALELIKKHPDEGIFITPPIPSFPYKYGAYGRAFFARYLVDNFNGKPIGPYIVRMGTGQIIVLAAHPWVHGVALKYPEMKRWRIWQVTDTPDPNPYKGHNPCVSMPWLEEEKMLRIFEHNQLTRAEHAVTCPHATKSTPTAYGLDADGQMTSYAVDLNDPNLGLTRSELNVDDAFKLASCTSEI